MAGSTSERRAGSPDGDRYHLPALLPIMGRMTKMVYPRISRLRLQVVGISTFKIQQDACFVYS